MRITSATDPLRILLIEDSKGDAILITKTLDSALSGAHTIKCASTLASALDIIAQQDFDVALLDRSLPDVSGYSGLLSIQNMAPKLPVIFLTGYRDESVALSAIEQGAQDYLFKDKLDEHVIKRTIQYAVLRKQFEGVLIMRANFDALTGLANRILFDSRLDLALARMNRHGGALGVMFLDLDRFKNINDNFGHYAGDRLLQQVAQRLKQCLRPYDTVARFGGDEFAILVEGLVEVGHCVAIARKIIQLFELPFQLDTREISMSVSIGIAIRTPEQGFNRDELMKQADTAMYKAKLTPGSDFQFFAPEPEEKRTLVLS